MVFLSPHPPILIPEIGQENTKKVEKTIKALNFLEEKLFQEKPETILIISPHGPIFSDAFNSNQEQNLEGNFSLFGETTINLKFKNDLNFVQQIKQGIKKENIPLKIISQKNLDHGSLVPLYFLAKRLKLASIIPIGFSFLDLETHFHFGKILAEEIAKSGKKISVIVSGDLSHRLSINAPAGYSAIAKKFDQKLISFLEKNNWQEILNLDPDLIEEAGECGLRSIVIGCGIAQIQNLSFQFLNYESPFGVGYLTGYFD